MRVLLFLVLNILFIVPILPFFLSFLSVPLFMFSGEDVLGLGVWVTLFHYYLIAQWIFKIVVFPIMYNFKNTFKYTYKVLSDFENSNWCKIKIFSITLLIDFIIYTYFKIFMLQVNIIFDSLTICYLSFWVWIELRKIFKRVLNKSVYDV